MKSLVSDSKMVPLDILDQVVKNEMQPEIKQANMANNKHLINNNNSNLP